MSRHCVRGLGDQNATIPLILIRSSPQELRTKQQIANPRAGSTEVQPDWNYVGSKRGMTDLTGIIGRWRPPTHNGREKSGQYASSNMQMQSELSCSSVLFMSHATSRGGLRRVRVQNVSRWLHPGSAPGRSERDRQASRSKSSAQCSSSNVVDENCPDNTL